MNTTLVDADLTFREIVMNEPLPKGRSALADHGIGGCKPLSLWVAQPF